MIAAWSMSFGTNAAVVVFADDIERHCTEVLSQRPPRRALSRLHSWGVRSTAGIDPHPNTPAV